MNDRSTHSSIFSFRHAIARIGESDWMKWWDSNALTRAGQYATPRIFRRTPELSGAHMAIVAARARHEAAVPNASLVHLFNLTEIYEGAFDRWMIERKAEGWTPEMFATTPADDQKRAVGAALEAVGIEPGEYSANGESAVAIGTTSFNALSDAGEREQLARTLASAYTASAPGRLVVPYVRVEA